MHHEHTCLICLPSKGFCTTNIASVLNFKGLGGLSVVLEGVCNSEIDNDITVIQ